MPLPVDSSNNLWTWLAEGPGTAGFAPGARPKRSAHRSPAPQPRHLQAGGRPPHPFLAKRLLQRALVFVSLALAKPGSLRAPGQPAGELLPTPPAVPRRPADARQTPGRRRRKLSSLTSTAHTLRAARVPRRLCLMRPGPRGRGQPGQPPLPTARRRPPSGAPLPRHSVAACARVREAAPYLSLRSRGASSRAASASPPPLLGCHRASSCSRRRDRRAKSAAAACAGAPLRLASPTHPACALRPGPAHRGRGARGHPAWSCQWHSHLRSPISRLGRLTHLSALEQGQPRAAPPSKANKVFRHRRSAAPASVYPDSTALSKGREEGPSCPGLSLILQVSVECPSEPGTSGERKRTLTSPQCPTHVLKWPFLKSAISLVRPPNF